MVKVRLFLSSCFSKLSSCAFACFAYFICSSRECLWLMFFLRLKKNLHHLAVVGFLEGTDWRAVVLFKWLRTYYVLAVFFFYCFLFFLITRFIRLVLQVNGIFKATGQAENKSCRHTCSLWERIHCLVYWIIFFEQAIWWVTFTYQHLTLTTQTRSPQHSTG